MSYSVSQLKQDLQGVLHGTTTNQITNLDQLIYRAARQVLLDVDPQETKRIASVGQVFNSVYDYSCPSDLKGNRVIDLYPQVNRQLTEVFLQDYNQPFSLGTIASLQDQFTILFNGMVKTIRINAPTLTPPTILNTCDSITANGTWAAGGNASSLATDNVNTVTGSGALKFNLSAGANPSTGYLENSTMSAIDLSAMKNQGYFFLWVYLPTASDFTNVILRWGSSSSNYYSVTATVTQANTTFANGWNLLSFAWNGASQTGTPVDTAINYARVTWTYDGNAQTAVHLDQISASMGTLLNIEYYSKFMFRDSSTNAFQESVTSNSNLINLDTESYNLLLYKVCELAVQQQQGLDATFYDGPYFADLYKEVLGRYRLLYRSEVQLPQISYYKMPRPGRSLSPNTRRSY